MKCEKLKFIIMRNIKKQFNNYNLYLHLIAFLSFAVIIYIEFCAPICKNCNLKDVIVNLSFSYLGGYMVYCVTVILKNKIERRRHVWQIYDKINLLYNEVSREDYPNKEDLIAVEDESCLLKAESLCKLREFLFRIDKHIVGCEIYYNMLNHCECESFICIKSTIGTLKDILSNCTICNNENQCEVIESAVLSKKQIDNVYAGLAVVIDNAKLLYFFINSAVKKI